MPVLARFMNFRDFYDFRKSVAAEFFIISKTPMVNFGFHYFLLFVKKNICFSLT